MIKAIAMIADGTEEVECLGVVDILRRAGVQTSLVAVGGKTIVSSHGVTITADKTVERSSISATPILFSRGRIAGHAQPCRVQTSYKRNKASAF